MSTNNLVTDGHLAALGGITLEYARLEHFVSVFIWTMIAADFTIGRTVTANLMFRARTSLLRSLFHTLSARGVVADTGAFEAVVGRAERAASKRNDVIHALIWHSGTDGDLAFTVLRKNAQWEQMSASVSDLATVANELHQAGVDVSDFMVEHFGGAVFPPADGRGTFYQRTDLPK